MKKKRYELRTRRRRKKIPHRLVMNVRQKNIIKWGMMRVVLPGTVVAIYYGPTMRKSETTRNDGSERKR